MPDHSHLKPQYRSSQEQSSSDGPDLRALGNEELLGMLVASVTMEAYSDQKTASAEILRRMSAGNPQLCDCQTSAHEARYRDAGLWTCMCRCEGHKGAHLVIDKRTAAQRDLDAALDAALGGV